MKNQPNKATVKDGLPTAEQIIREKIKEHSASTVKINVEDVPVFTHFLFVAIEAMQSYSDQQNAELREQLASEIESRDHWQRQARRYQKYHRELNAALERVKELEWLLAIWVKQNNYLRRHSISDFDDIHNQTKKALKK